MPAAEVLPQLLPVGGRHEVKFIAERGAYDPLCRWVLGHPSAFRTHHPARWINNIYFDSPDLRAYSDNLAGISRRSKLRLRWYGREARVDQAQLEYKLRRAQLGWKQSSPIVAADLLGMSWPQLRQQIREQLAEEIVPILDANPNPILINRYQRDYFVSGDEKIRVTLDRRQEVYDQRMSSGPKLGFRANLPDYSILEFKFASSQIQRMADILKDLPLRPSRSSKYVTGVHAILGYR